MKLFSQCICGTPPWNEPASQSSYSELQRSDQRSPRTLGYSGHAIEQVGAQLSNLLVEYGIRGYGFISICHVYLRMRARHVRTISVKAINVNQTRAASRPSIHPTHISSAATAQPRCVRSDRAQAHTTGWHGQGQRNSPERSVKGADTRLFFRMRRLSAAAT